MFVIFGIENPLYVFCCQFIEHENPSIDALQRCWAHENVHTNVDIWDDHFAEHNTSFTVLSFV